MSNQSVLRIFLLQINLRKHKSGTSRLHSHNALISYSNTNPTSVPETVPAAFVCKQSRSTTSWAVKICTNPSEGWEQTGQRCVTLHHPSSKAKANRASCVSWPCGPWYDTVTRNGRFLSAAKVFSNEGVSLGLGVAKKNAQTYNKT